MALTLRTHQRYQASQQEASQQAQRVAQLSILREMTRVIMDNLDLRDMLQAIGEQLQSGLAYAGFTVWLCEHGTVRWRQVYTSGTQYGRWFRVGEDDGPRELGVENIAGTQVVVAPIVLEGRPIGVVELVRDTRHGPLAAFEIELVRMVLDYLGIAVRNSQLHAQLLQSEKLRVLGEMAAGVAHNFNNILTTILGHTQLLLCYPGDAESMRNGLTTIEQATNDAAQMVRRIQTFARGGQGSKCRSTDLVEVVKEAVEATRPVWQEQSERQGKHIDVILKLEPVPAVHSQPAELREVLTNLILNAVDAMSDGGVLTLHTQQCQECGCVAVSDTGDGMSEDIRRRIFDPFFTTKKQKGTGLGLSVSHTLIRSHGGDIEVQSTPGNGTTFMLKLPLAAPTPPVPPTRTTV
jgi:signal transduction histidine kinase